MAILAECPTCHDEQSVKRKACKCGENLNRVEKAKRVRCGIQFQLTNGKQRKESVGFSISEVRDADSKRKVKKRENRIFDMLHASRMIFSDLSEWYLKLKMVTDLKYYPMVKLAIDRFNASFGETEINAIKPLDIENYRAEQKETSISDSYADQLTGCVKTMVNKAF